MEKRKAKYEAALDYFNNPGDVDSRNNAINAVSRLGYGKAYENSEDFKNKPKLDNLHKLIGK